MKKLLLLTLIQLLFAQYIFSGNVSGNINGRVTDENGKSVQYASVTIQEIEMRTTTDETGAFTFLNIPAGHYNITFSKTGYLSRTIRIIVESDNNILNVTLEKSLIETATIDVTSSFEAQDISKSTFSITTLNLRNLIKERSQILGLTIANIPGVNNITTGIGIGKPVIRGLSSYSVLIIHDGVKQETQQWGDEHSPEVSLFDLDRIEILRGPASLIYGSEGIGGVVNIISKPLQYSGIDKLLAYGNVDLGFFSVNNEGTGNLMLGIGTENFGFKGHFGYRKSGNVNTPEGNLLVNTLITGVHDTITGGALSNSGTKEIQGGMTLGYNGNFGYINAGFETFGRELRMHDPDPSATGNQKLSTNQFQLSGNFNLSRKFHLEPILSYQIHDRKEFESVTDKENENPALFLKLNTFQTDLRLHNDLNKNFSGTFGVAFSRILNQSLGPEKLIPSFNSAGFGVYALEKYNSGNITVSIGARFDTKRLNIENTVFERDSLGVTVKEVSARTIDFNAVTGSLGFVYRPDEYIDLFANIGRGWRAPSEFELYVDGIHEGTNRVERGIITLDNNASPTPESSLNFDIGMRARLKNFNAEISLFSNVVNNFIYPSPTNTVDSVSMLPVYDIMQDKSNFSGIEYSFQYQPVSFMLLSLNGDYIYTKNDGTGNPLPFTPPAKNIFEVRFQKNQFGVFHNPYFSFSARLVAAQNNVDILETTTDGYTLYNAGLGCDIIFAKTITSVDISVENITDTRYVDHLSRYKSYAMNPGRSFNLKLTVPFQY